MKMGKESETRTRHNLSHLRDKFVSFGRRLRGPKTTNESIYTPSRPEGLLDFMVNHDGNQPEIHEVEQERVGWEFRVFVNDLLLNYPEYVHSNDEQDLLTLRSPQTSIKVGNSSIEESWDIVIKVKKNPLSRTKMSIMLNRMSGEKLPKQNITFSGKELFVYNLGQDNIVGRYTQLQQKPNPLNVVDLDSADVLPQMKEAVEKVDVEELHEDLEELSRRQRQPIGKEEFEGLRRFVTQPGIKAPYRYRELTEEEVIALFEGRLK